MDGQTQGTTVPVQGSNPLLDAANAEVAAQTQAATNAAQVLKNTPMYSTSSSAQPQMPVPSLRSKLFSGASEHNLDNQTPVTRAGARNKAIGQIAGMGANIVGKYFQKKEAEKTQALAQDIHRTLELTERMDQAKTVLSDANASPQDKQQAQALIQKNQALLTAVLNGKNGKDIAKAYDITFGKESQSSSMDDKNASMHHQAMQDAMKQRGIDRAQAFQQQLPQKMEVNPAYQSAYKQYQDTVKNAQAAQKNYLDYAAKYQTSQARLLQEQMKEDAAAKLHAADDAAKAAQAHDTAMLRLKGDMAKVGASVFASRVKLQAAQLKHGDAQKTDAKDVYNGTNAEIAKNKTLILNAQKELDSMDAKDTNDPGLRKDLLDGIKNAQAANTELEKQNEEARLMMSGDPHASIIGDIVGGYWQPRK